MIKGAAFKFVIAINETNAVFEVDLKKETWAFGLMKVTYPETG